MTSERQRRPRFSDAHESNQDDLPLHVIAGAIGIASGLTALFVPKGSRLHRKIGTIFVCAMLVMAATAAGLAVQHGQRFNASQAVLTAYMVATALRTARERSQGTRWPDAGAMRIALIVALYDVRLGVEAVNSPRGTIDGSPAAMTFIFGAVALTAAIGDVRITLGRRLHGSLRIARHLWRMCFATFVATGSFFLGQARVIPEPVRTCPLLTILASLPLLLMPYWLRRVRVQRLPRQAG